MLLTEKRGFQSGNSKLGTWGLEPWAAVGAAAARGEGRNGADCQVCAAAGGLWIRLGGGAGQLVGQIGGFSHESEHDLAVMVSDFLENGSSGAESWCSSDSDSGNSDLNHAAEKISFHKNTIDQYESNLLLTVHSLILSLNEMDLQNAKVGPCNASCIRQLLVKLLRLSGYDAAICVSKWQGSGKVPGGATFDHLFEAHVQTQPWLGNRMHVESLMPSARKGEQFSCFLPSYAVKLSLLVKIVRLYDFRLCCIFNDAHHFQNMEYYERNGDHEYIDVVPDDTSGRTERVIVDIDFRSHFEIARAVESYDALLNSLPVVYVGPLPRLIQLLQEMVEAARSSLKQNSMPLPPWRSLAYLQAKWQSAYERKLSLGGQIIAGLGSSDHKQCIGHLWRLKSSLQSHIETERQLKPIIIDSKSNNNRRVKLDRWRQHHTFRS